MKHIISDLRLQYHEKRAQLAYEAENQLPYVDLSKKSASFLKSGVICDIFEGNAPYRPRYTLPDYAKYFSSGSEYLDITPPSNIYEAINALFILYRYTPSITGYPVYIGQLDELLEPFSRDVPEETFRKFISMFLTHVDRCYPDAFVHANIGPKDTFTGRILLETEGRLQNAVPNLSLKLSANTPESFKELAIKTALMTGKPYFVNHDLLKAELSANYGIASCYNTLKIGGGSHTLVRMNLKLLAQTCPDKNAFLGEALPECIESLVKIINARAQFLVEESKFFESSFLVKEGLLDLSQFTSMAGVLGLYDCVELLSGGEKMGMDADADELAIEILKISHSLLKSYPGAYCEGYDGKIAFHAQSGIDSDRDTSEGVRFRAGAEPDLADQLLMGGRLQRYFDSGVSDIVVFDKTAREHIPSVAKILDGAMKNNLKILSLNCSDSDLVRITGYLVKRSDMEKWRNQEYLREDSVKLGVEHASHNGVFQRTLRNMGEQS